MIEVDPLRNRVTSSRQLFFKPLQLDFHPANLLIELSSFRLILGLLPTGTAPFKDRFGSFEQLLLSKGYLIRMDLELPGNLTDRLQSPNCFQSDSILKLRIKSSTASWHNLSPCPATIAPLTISNPDHFYPPLTAGPKTGVHFNVQSMVGSLRVELPNGVVIHLPDNLDGQRLGDVILAAGQIQTGSPAVISLQRSETCSC